MKKIMFFLLLIVISFSGCSKDTPEEVVENMLKSMQAGDYVAFVRYTRDPFSLGMTIDTLHKCNVDIKKVNVEEFQVDEMKACFKKVYQYLDFRKAKQTNEVPDRVYVKARYIFNNKAIEDDFVLRDFDGEWKVTDYVKFLNLKAEN